MAWAIHLTSLLNLLYAKYENTKRNSSQSLSLGYMVYHPVWSMCGLKYHNEKYTYTFVDMDMDLHSAYTLNTELILSTTQGLSPATHSQSQLLWSLMAKEESPRRWHSIHWVIGI